MNDILPPRRANAPASRDPRYRPYAGTGRPPVQATPQLSRSQPAGPHPTFRTPEQVAASEQPGILPDPGAKPPIDPPKKSLKEKFATLSKKQWALIITIIVLVVGGAGAALYFFVLKEEPKPITPVSKIEKKEVPPPEPTTEASKLTGIQVDPALNERHVTGVMIENSLDARPQAGLKDAGVVFEAIAEGGITRFLALFQDTQPEYIGPVRSVRPYYIQWAMGFDAAIAHVGGSPEAIRNLKEWGAKDIDQFHNAKYYRRVSNRFAPHNMYTSMADLTTLQNSKGFTTSTYTGFARKKEAAAATPTAKAIDFAISSANYNTHFDYDTATNSYLRFEGGQPHKDEKSGQQLNPKVVVGLIVPYRIAADRVHSIYETIGSGKAFIFQDGMVTEATWNKGDHKANITFTDSSGKAVGLNPGQTWVTALGAANKVTYRP